jgi:hypothetical protein
MIIPIQNFCADLCERTEDAVVYRHELPRLREAGAVYKADPLYEAVADLTDALLGHEQGRLGEDVARQEALRVCRLAVLLWLSICAGEDGDDGCR